MNNKCIFCDYNEKERIVDIHLIIIPFLILLSMQESNLLLIDKK